MFDPTQPSFGAPPAPTATGTTGDFTQIQQPLMLPDMPQTAEDAMDTCIDPEAELGDETRERDCVEGHLEMYRYYRDCPERQMHDQLKIRGYHAYVAESPLEANRTVIRKEIYKQVHTLIPQRAKGLMWGDDLFKFLPRLEGFEEQAAGATTIVHDQINRYGGRQALSGWNFNTCVFGTAYVMVGWSEFKKTRMKLDSMHSDQGEEWQKRTSYDVLEEAPRIECLSPFEIFSDPFIDEARNSPVVYQPRIMSGGDLKTLVREGYLDADVVFETIKEASSTRGLLDGVRPPFGYRDANDWLASSMREQTSVMCLRCLTFDGWEYFILKEKRIARAMRIEGGEIPIITDRLVPVPGQHFSKSLPMLLVGEQAYVNEVMGIHVKSLRFSCVPLMQGSASAKKAWNEMLIGPGGFVAVASPNDAITPIEVPNQMQELATIVNMSETSMARAMGLPDVIGGTGTSGTNTATGLTSLQRAAGDRLQQSVVDSKPQYAQVYRALYDLNAWHPNEKYSVRVAGATQAAVWKHYDQNVFVPNIDVECVIGAQTGIDVANAWLNIAKNYQNSPVANQEWLYLKIIEAMGETHPKSALANPHQTPQDVMSAIAQLQMTGIIAPAKPTDDHMTWVKGLMMFVETAAFQQMLPEWQGRAMGALSQHMQYMQMMQQAQSAMQQGPGALPQPGQGAPQISPAAQSGNAAANGRFDMATMGRSQMGAA